MIGSIAHFHLQPDEKVIMSLRRHPIVFLAEAAVIAILGLATVLAYFLIVWYQPDWLTGPISRPLLVLAGSAYLLLVWHFFIARFVDFYLDMWVLTTEKILNVEQHSLFSRTVSELDLAMIQDVTSEVRGILPTILNYGYVHVQTAGEVKRFVFEQVPNPEAVRGKILQLVEEERRRTVAAKPALDQK
ncbi:hypothetical protein A3C96_02060 [Candidatus Uhrbacteria bacterium RIFCSPHIGHO2_02_FULL_60_10]|uniref:YdbS-like PH domain-containing protein n=1 Tax=Candidatus Uhrbacteria bacterium RIFCSPHIGHO2_02_FULL_60_10 TaxID=1802392 RepID=A0A1F7U6J3_9BACT|nr:MAG: hypothetical protein A3C96_02060 [Candidatus Uhrbacteria bacterium RIFCSPHIGHO2_02_FULL_60_10]